MAERRTATEREGRPQTIEERPAKGHVSAGTVERDEQIDPTGSERQPDPATREEHLRSPGGVSGRAIRSADRDPELSEDLA
jgi:hypothetical protein